MQHSEIIFEEQEGQYGTIGSVLLNRPHALNALTEDMCLRMYKQLKVWRKSEKIKAVLIQGTGDKAFCAGGDVRAIYDNRNQLSSENNFFKNEYRLNALIFHYPKPYIALMNGITMGGGAGVSVHGKYRIGTEKLKFAMPETGIGFFPDVGGTYFLSRCPRKSGWYMGLTGQMIDIDDILYAGLVNIQIPSEKVYEVCNVLNYINWSDEQAFTNMMGNFKTTPDLSELENNIDLIEKCFTASSIENVLSNLQHIASEWAIQTREILLKRSPTSLKVTFEALKRAEHLEFDQCMEMEYHIACQFLKGHDFYEGVRAALVDKDKHPRWQPETLSGIDMAEVSKYFGNRIDTYSD